jgi:hypothetical protein
MMMQREFFKPVLLVVLMLLWGHAYSQDKNIPKELYQASTIPDSLKEEANAVVRHSSVEFVVKAPGRATSRHHSIITILNEKADEEAAWALFYDRKFNSVGSAEMLVYDANGKQIKKYRKSDMYDRSAADGISIITDNRVLLLEHSIVSYPVTIEKIYEESMNSFLDLSDWRIQQPEIAVQNSQFKVSVNPSVGFRFKNKNTGIKPQKGTENNYETYTWQVKNLKAVKPEDDVPAWRVMPKIMFATNQFEFDGIPGDISTWANYGKWISGLNADVNRLTPKREEEIRNMTASLPNDKEKARFLYTYLQQNMRYVSIQLGIGGLKPFPAMFVDQKKYGDCKALSNYMYALLKAVNIPSYYALVRAGTNEEPADPAFPNDPFNHIILCIPFKSDTTWLECTSNTKPFGKLGEFTENRNALLITEDGGKLVNTPRSNILDNQFTSETHLILNPDGSAKAAVKIKGTGGYRDVYVGLAAEKLDDQKEYIIRSLNLKQPSVFNFTDASDKDGTKEVNIDLEYDKFCDVMAGTKQFYRPRVFDLWRLTVPVTEKRKTDFYFDHPMQKVCVTTIDLPQGYEVESMPQNTALKFTYGNYEVNYNYDAAKNQIISTAKFNLTNQVVPAAKYAEMQQYMDDISKAQNKKLVIKRKA